MIHSFISLVVLYLTGQCRRSRQERRDSSREKEASGFGFAVEVDPMGNESGYRSEPGYRGDVELGYGDEYDDEEEDVKLLFWGGKSSKLYNTSV